ncbi:hypothetical protein E6P97_03045 [Patescibacteria group bacterium]|nr:MAG: hypothetical protein E6P97_03045 [Patescibacteria group bacterium]
MNITNLQQAEEILASYRPDVKEFLGKDMTLDRMRPLMEVLGNPQDKLRIIHIAGTSGKTSTSQYLAHMLRLTGSKVGLAASPHIDSITERVQIDDLPITEREFCDKLAIFLDCIKDVQSRPSYYELLVAFAYDYFAEQSVDFAVVETGLGGLHDGTNIAQREDKLCIITDIGYDHTKVLGETLPEISAQKAGIIHPGNHVVMFRQGQEVMETFRAHCDDVGATIQEVGPDLVDDFAFDSQMPLYQRRNWTLAWSAYQRLANVHDLPVIEGDLIGQSRQLIIPGRMEILQRQDQTLILDGAHNAQKMSAFVTSFQALYPGKQPVVLLSVRDRKDFTSLIEQLIPLARKLILTSFYISQDIEHQNARLDEIAQHCLDRGFQSVVIEPNQHQAFGELMAADGDIKIITGSFYLIQQIKQRELS